MHHYRLTSQQGRAESFFDGRTSRAATRAFLGRALPVSKRLHASSSDALYLGRSYSRVRSQKRIRFFAAEVFNLCTYYCSKYETNVVVTAMLDEQHCFAGSLPKDCIAVRQKSTAMLLSRDWEWYKAAHRWTRCCTGRCYLQSPCRLLMANWLPDKSRYSRFTSISSPSKKEELRSFTMRRCIGHQQTVEKEISRHANCSLSISWFRQTEARHTPEYDRLSY